MNYTFSKKIGLSLVVAVVAFFIAQMAYAQVWTPPTAQFPAGNTEAPIHVGGNAQSKGSISFASAFANAIKTDDLFSEYSMYSKDLVAAPKFCITPAFGDYTAALAGDMTNCITSWSGGQGGDMPAGADTQTLRHNGTEWIANSILQNDGVTVTVQRGAGDFTQSGGNGGIIFNPGGTPPDGPDGGGVIDGSIEGTESGGQSGFNYIKDLFSANKAFAQNANSTAPIFRAIKLSQLQGQSPRGLQVLHNGVTHTKGGFISQGDAAVTGELEVDDDAALKGRTLAHRITVQDQGNNSIPGGILEAWDGNFDWNGSGGEFTVGSPADFNGSLQITSGNPGAGKVLTSDADGNATWEPALGQDISITTSNNSGTGSASASCNGQGTVIGGGAWCQNATVAFGVLVESKKTGNSWSATCRGVGVGPLGELRPTGAPGVNVTAICMDVTETGGPSSSQSAPPSGPEWNSSTSVNFIGELGESCLAMTNDHVLPGLGWPTASSANDIGLGGNANGSSPTYVGECSYQQGTSGTNFDIKPATFTGSNWRPFWNVAIATPFWSRH